VIARKFIFFMISYFQIFALSISYTNLYFNLINIIYLIKIKYTFIILRLNFFLKLINKLNYI